MEKKILEWRQKNVRENDMRKLTVNMNQEKKEIRGGREKNDEGKITVKVMRKK